MLIHTKADGITHVTSLGVYSMFKGAVLRFDHLGVKELTIRNTEVWIANASISTLILQGDARCYILDMSVKDYVLNTQDASPHARLVIHDQPINI